MGATAIVLVPPILKYTAGPLLGPAMLAGAAQQSGHQVHVVDWNAEHLRTHGCMTSSTPGRVIGDHDRPGEILRRAEASVRDDLREMLSGVRAAPGIDDPVLLLACSFESIEDAAKVMANGQAGQRVAELLEAHRRPDLLGVSVLWSGQVVHGLAASIVARRLWPGVPIIWGGAHVSALAELIARDGRYGRLIDRFAFGYAEATFVAMLDAIEQQAPWPEECHRAGEGTTTRALGVRAATPAFTELERYDNSRLTLPIQASRGCAYGACTYCTYPAIEGEHRVLELRAVDVVVEEAVARRAMLSFKDAFMTIESMRQVAGRIGGRVVWSACTMLTPELDRELLYGLARDGLRTLEIGAETFDPEMQRLIRKRQRLQDLETLAAGALAAGVALVVNYMEGLPHEVAARHHEFRGQVERVLEQLEGRGLAKLHVSRFQLERLSYLARHPEQHGLAVTDAFPWSSVLGWQSVRGRRLA